MIEIPVEKEYTVYMETNNNRTWIIVIAIIIIGVTSFYLGKNSSQGGGSVPLNATTTTGLATSTTNGTVVVATTTKNPTLTKPQATTLPKVNTAGFNSFSDSQNNFVIKFPSYITSKNTFSTFHELGNNWRMYAGPANQGKPVIEIPVYSIDQGSLSTGKQTYPLFFTALVRVGVSPNTKECYTPDAGYTNQKITNVTINGTTWKRFSTQEGGMMKYIQVESYRTIHNNMCFAVEQIKNGSSYRDEKMTVGKTEAELTSYYNVADTIVRTFVFTK